MSFYLKCGEQYFLSYIRVIFQGYDVLGADYGFDI